MRRIEGLDVNGVRRFDALGLFFCRGRILSTKFVMPDDKWCMSNFYSIERLETFWLVVEKGGFGPAAEGDKKKARHFSRQVSELEEFFQAKLLNRDTNPVSLTERGRSLFDAWNEFQDRIRVFRDKCNAKPLSLRIGGGDRLLHWFVIPSLSKIQAALPDSRIQLHNCPSRQVLERINALALDIGVVRTSEVKKGLKSFEIPSRFTYSLFVPAVKAPADKNAVWVIQNVPLAIVERYQSEFLTAAEEKQIRPKVHLLCSTFPQAWRAVASGYAAVLPTAAFSPQELAGIRRLDVPFAMPKFEQDETTISVVWNRRLEEIRENFPDILKVFRECLAGTEQTVISAAPKPTQQSMSKSALPPPKKKTATDIRLVSK